MPGADIRARRRDGGTGAGGVAGERMGSRARRRKVPRGSKIIVIKLEGGDHVRVEGSADAATGRAHRLSIEARA